MTCGLWVGHDWTKEVFIPWAGGSIAVKCCKECHVLQKSRNHIIGLTDVDPQRLNEAREEALTYDFRFREKHGIKAAT